MSQSFEPGDENNTGEGGNDNEFEFYFQFTKPLVLYLPTPEDRAIAASWVQKLQAQPETEEERRLQLDYLKLLLFVLQRGRLSGIFRKQPPSGPLQPFPQGFNMSDMGNLIIDEDDTQGCGGGDARLVPYTVEISNDLREFVAAQEIPNFGVQMYYAWSSDDPIHKWSLFDEEKFPQYVLDKIKLLKEIKSDDKTGGTTKTCGAKKLCDVPLVEKYTRTKVKSPQEIEKSLGRSYQTYVGLVGRMGGFKDMCDDSDRYKRQDQRKNRCPKKTNKKCVSGPNGMSGEHGEMPCVDEYDNFVSGLGGNSQRSPRGCRFPNSHQMSDCDSQMKSMSNYEEKPNGSRHCSPKSRADGSGPSWGTPGPVVKSPCRGMNYSQGQFPETSMMQTDTMQMSSGPQRRCPSPTNRTQCFSSRNECNPPPDNCPGQRSANSSPCNYTMGKEQDSQCRAMQMSPSGRQNGDRCRITPKAKPQWGGPAESSYRGNGSNRCPPVQSDLSQCFEPQDQCPPINQCPPTNHCPPKIQCPPPNPCPPPTPCPSTNPCPPITQQPQRMEDDNWCCDSCEMNDDGRRSKGKQFGQECRDDEMMDPCSRTMDYQSPSTYPPRQGPRSPMSPQQMTRGRMKTPDMQPDRRRDAQMDPQQQDYCSSVVGGYGPTVPMPPNCPRGPDSSVTVNFCGSTWKQPSPVTSTPVKQLNFDYSQDFDDGCSSFGNRSNNPPPCPVDPCAKDSGPMRNPCQDREPKVNDPCNQSQRSVRPGGTWSSKYLTARKQNVDNVFDNIKQKTETHRETCEPFTTRQQMSNEVNPCQRNFQQYSAVSQSPSQSPPVSQIKNYAPSAPEGMMPGPQRNGRYDRNMSMSQLPCGPLQHRSATLVYDNYNIQKGSQGPPINVMGVQNAPAPPPNGMNYKGPFGCQNISRTNAQEDELCPEMCQEEEEDECLDSADDRPQVSTTSGEGFETGEDVEGGCMEDVPTSPWLRNLELRPKSLKTKMLEEKMQRMMNACQMGADKKNNYGFTSTPSYEMPNKFSQDPMNNSKQFDPPSQNFYGSQDANVNPFMQMDDNYTNYPCNRNKQKMQRTSPQTYEEQNYNQPCGY